MTQQLQQIIDAAWENRANISAKSAPKEVADAVEHVIAELNKGGSLFVTRPSLNGYADTRERFEMMCDDLFAVIESGDVKIRIGQRFGLEQAADAHRALANRETTGSTILTL